MISDLHLVDVDILGNDLVGGFVGRMRDNSTFTNCSVSGRIRGESRVGGIVGYHFQGTVEDCWTEGEIEMIGAKSVSGGIAGYSSSLIQNSYSTMNISGGDWVGGLVGRADTGSVIEESFATGDVTGTGVLIGGLVGAQSGLIVRSYATGSATGLEGSSATIGGLVGRQDAGADIQDSFARGNGTGPNTVGGLLGLQRGGASVSRSFSTGIPTSETANVGGLLGSQQEGTVTASYWDTVSSGLSTSPGGEGAIGLTTAEMTSPFGGGAYTDWDFADVWLEEEEANDGYPIHRWQTARHTLQYTSAGGGSLEGELQQIRIPGLSGTVVTAIPDKGFTFVEWSDGSTENPRRDLKVTSDFNVTAIFLGPELDGSLWMIN